MNYELIYDAASTSEAPLNILKFALGIAAFALLWGGWLKFRGQPLHGGVKFVALAAALIGAVSALSRYEQYTIAKRTDVKTIEGPVMGFWQKEERYRRADDSYSTAHWEGFSINGVPFVYRRFDDQNYFHNSGAGALELKDGVYLRLNYVSEDNKIVRVEKAVLP
jgi:hypothetical protein